MRVIVHPSDGLVIVPAPIARAATRGAAADGAVLPPEFRSDKVTVEKTYTVSRAPANAARAAGNRARRSCSMRRSSSSGTRRARSRFIPARRLPPLAAYVPPVICTTSACRFAAG